MPDHVEYDEYGNPIMSELENDSQNPIVEVSFYATENDSCFFVENPEEQYVGPYHRPEAGTLMIGIGVL